MSDQTNPALPLFYRDPQPLSSVDHATWRLAPGTAGFAGETAYVPIVVGEFARACHHYPIVFAGEEAAPLALTGLENANLFVDAAGDWDADAYVPAYVRRYPFGFIPTNEEGRFVLALDLASDRVLREGDAGVALFDEGKPSDVTQQALAFCDAFRGEAEATLRFTAALKEQDLLIERRADATLPDGRTLGVQGFHIIDAEKLGKLADDVVVQWHREGWLALAYLHLNSLENFTLLLARQGKRAPAQAVAA